jgi:hypothetical protein
LQGAGLTTIAGKLAVTSNISRVSTVPTISDASRATSFIWEGGNNTFNLPSSIGLSTGWWIAFRNNGTGTLVLTPATGELINKLVNVSVPPNASGFIFYQQSTGEFYTIGLQTPSNVTFTSAVYDVDNIQLGLQKGSGGLVQIATNTWEYTTAPVTDVSEIMTATNNGAQPEFGLKVKFGVGNG